MSCRPILPSFVLALILGGGVSAQPEPPLEDLLARILPTEAETAWRTVPWRTTLWSALADARAADKPILLWAMNGHPLGCV